MRRYIMKKTIFATLTILAPLMFSHVVMANEKQPETAPSIQAATSQELTNNDIMETAANYQIAQIETHQPRRSALFAQILDVVTQGSSLADAADHR